MFLRVDWAFKSNKGPLVRLTDGFYPVPEKHKDFLEGGKYRLKYDMLPNAGGWRFRLVNNGTLRKKNKRLFF